MSLAIKAIKTVDKYLGVPLCVVVGGLSNAFRSQKAIKAPKNIAFVKFWALGDSVMTLPLIKAAKKRYPKAKITLFVKHRNLDVYKHQSCIDEINTFEGVTVLKYIFLHKKFDYFIDLEPYLNVSALIAWYMGKERIGFAHGVRSLLYNKTSPFHKDRHMFDIYQELGKRFGVLNVPRRLIRLHTTDRDKKTVQDFLQKNHIKKTDLLIGVAPGAAESARQRMWPKERFARLCDKLARKYKAKLLFFGAANEAELMRSIQGMMRQDSINTAGKLTLQQAFGLIEKCKIFISNDAGLMHVAAAQGCKVIGLFGPNTPKRWAPFTKQSISLYHKLWCSPCIINEKGIMPPCINKEFQKCMKLISVEEVEEAVKDLLK
jgi:heptosyltransferase-2